jgi:mycothiol system anti-sigma-R factor
VTGQQINRGDGVAMDQADGHRPTGGALPGAPLKGDCQQALDTLYHFLDGELTEERRHEIQHHLDDCSPCLEAFDFEAELKMVIAHRCRETVPESLRLRIAISLQDASGSFDRPEEETHPHQPRHNG